jgi:tripartite-type tricarboxylate transporter receptor subunit TctC
MDRRQIMITAVATLGAALPAVAWGQTFPVKPIRIVNAFGPSSAVEQLSRLLAPHMQEVLGQPIIVESIQGASGTVAAQTVARAKPDGYTILMVLNNTFGPNAHLMPTDQYNPLTAFAPIMPVCNVGLVLVAGPASPAQTFRGVIEASQRQVVTYGTAGIGTSLHLVGELLRERTKGNLMHVPYKGGGHIASDLLAGQIATAIVGYAPTAGFIKEGRLKALAVCGTQRLSALPDVPTLAELVPGVTTASWAGLVAPAGTPAGICRLIADAAEKGLADREVVARLAAVGMDQIKGGADELRRMIKNEYDESGDIIRRLNIRLN